MWGQTMNADYLKPTAVALGFVAKEEHFGWHRFRHSLSTWADEETGDITISQTLLRHANPGITGKVYTHGDDAKALEVQEQILKRMLAAKPAREVISGFPSGWASGWDLTTNNQQPRASDYAASR